MAVRRGLDLCLSLALIPKSKGTRQKDFDPYDCYFKEGVIAGGPGEDFWLLELQ